MAAAGTAGPVLSLSPRARPQFGLAPSTSAALDPEMLGAKQAATATTGPQSHPGLGALGTPPQPAQPRRS